MADISDRNEAADALVRATINGSEADIVEALFRLNQSVEPEPVVKKYENQKTPCTDECYVRISDLKEAILNNPYDPAKGEIGGYLRYLKYNTPFRIDAWIPCSERLPEKDDRYIVTLVGSITMVDSREFFDGRWCDDRFIPLADQEQIVAWMPRPEPYKEGGEDGRS